MIFNCLTVAKGHMWSVLGNFGIDDGKFVIFKEKMDRKSLKVNGGCALERIKVTLALFPLPEAFESLLQS